MDPKSQVSFPDPSVDAARGVDGVSTEPEDTHSGRPRMDVVICQSELTFDVAAVGMAATTQDRPFQGDVPYLTRPGRLRSSGSLPGAMVSTGV